MSKPTSAFPCLQPIHNVSELRTLSPHRSGSLQALTMPTTATMADYTVCLLDLIVGSHSYLLPSSSSFLRLLESVVRFCGSLVAPLYSPGIYILQFFQTSGFTHSAHFMSQCCGASGNHQTKIISFFPLCAVGPRHDGKSRPR